MLRIRAIPIFLFQSTPEFSRVARMVPDGAFARLRWTQRLVE